MEVTFLRTFCMANHLKSDISAGILPRFFQQFQSTIDGAFCVQVRDITSEQALTFDPESELRLEVREELATSLPIIVYGKLITYLNSCHHAQDSDHYKAQSSPSHVDGMMLNPIAQSLRMITHRGRQFCTARSSIGDSNVVVRTHYEGSSLAQIQDLFVHKRMVPDGGTITQTFAVVKFYSQLSSDDMQYDPYRRFNHLHSRLMYAVPSADIAVMSFKDIKGHFASCPFEDSRLNRSCISTIPLDDS
ncbi:uncharacterized protein LAESUDRAFT_651556 [Laetiporus sulphureus 93-53]|uniref:Uncharacterized protein n=1 Tax=Laetiporus sulphureus 93-53 TaxID=1314785 RepID=A0A165EJ66_9APHY|nr:uncharacterized protein LAESUDRAFT_651556 [Laetiporus sulphureus 93-53]KZT07160.1 hypothetical protein LAESUDRAFT_651556 [Laetiporus sulphureus 93-53]